jgi:hypothetical protein
MSADPFVVLGLGPGATPDDVRAARRDLARLHHPDAGGDVDAMRRINVAAEEALKLLVASGAAPRGEPPVSSAETITDWVGLKRDVPSFVVEALPVETFEALLLAAAELGEVEDDDPPYELCTLLAAPVACWCQLDVVPDAGASTVSISIAPVEGCDLPNLLDVRNAWINALNALDWADLSSGR